MSSRQVTRKRGTQHPPARLPAPNGAASRRPVAQQLDDEVGREVRRPVRARTRGRQRRSPFAGNASKETREWIFAGSVFLVLILAVVLGIHVIGGGSTSTAARPSISNQPGGFGPAGAGGGGNAAVTTAVATALGISSDTLTSDLQQGMTVAEIASAQNVPIATVNTAYLSAAKTLFDAAVTNGTVTQAQADQIYSEQQTQVGNGQYLLLGVGTGASATATP